MRSRLRSFVLDSLILSSWLLCVGMVFLHKHGQLWGGFGNPTSTLAATMDAKEQWFGLYYQGQRIGFSQMTLVPEEREGVPGVGLMDRGRLSFNLLGVPQQLEVSAQAFIDADWRLQEFSAAVRSATTQLQWAGRRHGEELLLTVTTPTSSVRKRLRDPAGSAFVNGLSSWAAFHRLRVGQSGKAWVLNPLALNPEAVYFHVRGRDVIEGQNVLIVETDVSGLTTTSWVTPEGDVLKETSPLGWELRRESRDEALQRVTVLAPQLDLLATVAVPIDRPIPEPERLERLVLLLEGIDAAQLSLQRPWQTVLAPARLASYHQTAPAEPWCIVQLDAPTIGTSASTSLDGGQRYQQASLFVQSDNPRIISKAAEIVGARTDPIEQAGALTQWVYQTLTKQFTVGLPSALDVLETPAGDCHEHTVLFTALARSLGIPTRMVAGLVYQAGQLYYHAWPEVWLHGQWIPTDPTLGERVADATHLGLVEAENESLLGLAQFVGKLRVHVLDMNPPPRP